MVSKCVNACFVLNKTVDILRNNINININITFIVSWYVDNYKGPCLKFCLAGLINITHTQKEAIIHIPFMSFMLYKIITSSWISL
jgi:hypothetical protein